MASHDHGGDGNFHQYHDHHHSHQQHEHGHTHEHLAGPGDFQRREMPAYRQRNWRERAFTVGVGGY